MDATHTTNTNAPSDVKGATATNGNCSDEAASRSPAPLATVPDEGGLQRTAEETLRTETIRLMLGAMESLGYPEAAAALHKASGVAFAQDAALQLEKAVLAGEWETASRHCGALIAAAATDQSPVDSTEIFASLRRAQFLEGIFSFADARPPAAKHVDPSQAPAANGNGCAKGSVASAANGGGPAKVMGPDWGCPHRIAEAARVLRLLAPYISTAEVHRLSSVLAAPTYDRARTIYGQFALPSRHDVLQGIKARLPAGATLERGRLATLLKAVQGYSEEACVYHNSRDPITLLRPHKCNRDETMPSEHRVTLRCDDRQVWGVVVSPDGALCVAHGSGTAVFVFSMADVDAAVSASHRFTSGDDGALQYVQPSHVINDHTDGVVGAKFSDSSASLVTACSDQRVRVFARKSPYELVNTHTLKGHNEPVTAIAWMPRSDGQLLSASEDHFILRWELGDGCNTKILQRWCTLTVYDMTVLPDASALLVANSDGELCLYNIDSGKDYVDPSPTVRTEDMFPPSPAALARATRSPSQERPGTPTPGSTSPEQALAHVDEGSGGEPLDNETDTESGEEGEDYAEDVYMYEAQESEDFHPHTQEGGEETDGESISTVSSNIVDGGGVAPAPLVPGALQGHPSGALMGSAGGGAGPSPLVARPASTQPNSGGGVTGTKAVLHKERRKRVLTSIQLDASPYSKANGVECLAACMILEGQGGHLQTHNVESGAIVTTYTSTEYHPQSYVLRPCFGGIASNFICSGTEDGGIVVFHRGSGRELGVLRSDAMGRTSVNAVVWAERNVTVPAARRPRSQPLLFAACDAGTVCVFAPKSHVSDEVADSIPW